jgi:hypothetical protein
MGTGIETFTSERARRRWSEPPKENEDSLQRAWSAVSKTRMVFGLVAAGIFPSLLFWAIISLLIGMSSGDFVTALVSIGFMAIWYIGVGSLFLSWLGRRYGVIERFNCLALCTTLAFFVPLIIWLIEIALDPADALADVWKSILGAGLIGLVATPLGLVGGWFLWRFAIRPAARPLKEIAEVF